MSKAIHSWGWKTRKKREAKNKGNWALKWVKEKRGEWVLERNRQKHHQKRVQENREGVERDRKEKQSSGKNRLGKRGWEINAVKE